MKNMSYVVVGRLIWLNMGILSSFADITTDLRFHATFEGGDLTADINTHADWAKTNILAFGVSNSPDGRVGRGIYVDDHGTNGIMWRVGTFYTSGSICFWFKPDGWVMENTADNTARRDLQSITIGDSANQNGIITGSGQYSALQSVRYSSYTGSYIGSINASQGSDWIHIAVVWSNGETSKLYINGSDAGISGNDQMLAQSTEQLVIGNRKAAGLTFSNESGGGWYDNVRLYSRVLSDTDVAEIYHTVVPIPASGTIIIIK